ncbi:CoA transferase [Myxococcota bacterium]|nr:CoA transferase [Myxococcota bacterium]
MLLAPYRVLDLTDHRGEIAGMVLGDLGADVVRVEPPSGSEARRQGPRCPATPGPEGSLQFAAYNRNKRSVVLDLDETADRERFLALAAGADFVLESWPPGDLARVGIDFSTLKKANPHVIHVRITPFGSDGPYAEYTGSDLTIAAMGGPVSVQGVPERPPVRLSVPQVWRHTGVEAVVAALVAHARMRRTGQAQSVDVSAQAAMTWTMLNAMAASAIQGRDFERQGSALQLGKLVIRLVFACADGHLVTLGNGGNFGNLLPWVREDGLSTPALEAEDWETYDRRVLHGEPVTVSDTELNAVLERFFAGHTKQELFEWGLERHITLAPVNTLADLLAFPQLAARNAFAPVNLPDGRPARSPGVFAKLSATPIQLRRPAPRLDEHRAEILAELDASPRSPAEADPTHDADALPFEGLKVFDLSWIGVGPISARALADHGATVVKVESDQRPDGLRSAGPFMDEKPGWNRSHFYGDFNPSKLSLALDLKRPEAQEIAVALVEWADVFLESWTPGAAERAGLGYEQVRARNPSIVMVSTCLMGQYGPAAAMAGYGYHAGAVAGFYELAGWPDLPPSGPWQAYTDVIAPRFLISMLLSALDHRRRTGEGQYIDAAQMEMALQFLAPELLDYQCNDVLVTRCGNQSAGAAPQGVYPCEGNDAWCAIAVDDDQQWRGLQRALGNPAWMADTDLDHSAGRAARHEEIDARLSEWTRQHSSAENTARLQAEKVPAGPVQRSSDLLRDPQYGHRHFYHFHDHPEMGRIPYTGHAYRIDGYSSGPRTPAPLLGEHSFQVLKDLLGMSDAEIARLAESGVIG